jgi:hypothetical protein
MDELRSRFAVFGASRDGEVIAISSAERFHNTKLRRAQVLAADSELCALEHVPVGLGAGLLPILSSASEQPRQRARSSSVRAGRKRRPQRP